MNKHWKAWTRWVLAAGIAGVGIAGVVQSQHRAAPIATRPAAPHPQRHRQPPAPMKTTSAAKTPTRAPTLNMRASFAAASGLPATTALQVVQLPWAPQTRWAVDPVVHIQNGFPPTLWVGAQTGAHPWAWYLSRLPGHEPSQMPLGPRTALQEAYDLHAGMPGPQLLGPISWAALTGHVSRPRGITLAVLPADASPTGAPAVAVTVWMQSNTATFAGVYGLQTIWDAANAATGRHDLNGFVAEPTLKAALAASNP